MTNHKWNVLNIMRFYTRIKKPFSAKVYLEFITPHDGPANRSKNVPTLSEIQLIIRRYIENKWAVRVGDNVVITQKGIIAMVEWEKKVSLAAAKKRELDYVAKGNARPVLHGPDGKFLAGGGKGSRHKKKEVR
jgi:hypothetical protein